MAEQQNDKQINKQNTSETKTVDPSYAERLAKALESLKGKPMDTDTEELWPRKLLPHERSKQS
jgi:catalase